MGALVTALVVMLAIMFHLAIGIVCPVIQVDFPPLEFPRLSLVVEVLRG